jgi:hypothetical protein
MPTINNKLDLKLLVPTNEFVKLEKDEGKRSKQRSVADFCRRVTVSCFAMVCHNYQRDGGITGPAIGVAKATIHRTLACVPAVMNRHPLELQEQHRKLLCEVMATGASRAAMFTEHLANEVIREDVPFSKMAQHMEEAHEVNRDDAIKHHGMFVNQEEHSGFFPEFDNDSCDGVFGPPEEHVIKHIFNQVLALVRPFLQCNLFNRFPGRWVFWDGTFKCMIKTLSYKNSPGSNNVAMMTHDVC